MHEITAIMWSWIITSMFQLVVIIHGRNVSGGIVVCRRHTITVAAKRERRTGSTVRSRTPHGWWINFRIGLRICCLFYYERCGGSGCILLLLIMVIVGVRHIRPAKVNNRRFRSKGFLLLLASSYYRSFGSCYYVWYQVIYLYSCKVCIYIYIINCVKSTEHTRLYERQVVSSKLVLRFIDLVASKQPFIETQ